jgi:hypothetical protein
MADLVHAADRFKLLLRCLLMDELFYLLLIHLRCCIRLQGRINGMKNVTCFTLSVRNLSQFELM